MATKKKQDNGIQIADLSELCSKKQQNEGMWFQMATNGVKWDVDVLVYGNDSDIVQEYEREKMKERVKNINFNNKKNIEIDDSTVDEVFAEAVDSVLIRIGGIRKHSTQEALNFNGNVLPIEKNDSSEALYRALLEGSPDISDFVLAKSKEREDFLAYRKKN